MTCRSNPLLCLLRHHLSCLGHTLSRLHTLLSSARAASQCPLRRRAIRVSILRPHCAVPLQDLTGLLYIHLRSADMRWCVLL